jgi:hypothetical protein
MWVLTNGPLNAPSISILSYEGSDYKNSVLNCIPQCKCDGLRTQRDLNKQDIHKISYRSHYIFCLINESLS